MKAFMNHFLFDFRTGMRDKNLLLLNYLFPLGFFVMMGMLMTKINPLFSETMVPAMIIFSILVSTALALPNPLVSSREAGVFRSYKINGVPAISILTIPAIATIFHTLIVAAIITVLGPAFFQGQLPQNWGGFVVSYFAAVIACAGMGLLIGVVSANSRVTVLWSQLVFLPSMLLGGLMLPTSMLPESLARVSRILPSTYAMNAFQGLAQNEKTLFSPVWSVVILILGGIAAFLLSIYLFRWDSKNYSKQRNPLLGLLALLPYVLGIILL
jgi:ABC-2 type transport system permease protein